MRMAQRRCSFGSMIVRFGSANDIVGEVIMDVVATGESCRTVSVDWPWPRVPDDFANNISDCDVLQLAEQKQGCRTSPSVSNLRKSHDR